MRREPTSEDDGSVSTGRPLRWCHQCELRPFTINDAEGDGDCDEDKIGGCTDAEACNYDAAATDDNSSCTYPAADNPNCDGSCINHAVGDGLYDEDESRVVPAPRPVTTTRRPRMPTTAVHILEGTT